MKICMFRTVRLPIIRSLFTVHSAMVYVIQVCRQLSSRTTTCSKAVYKPVWHIPLLSVQWLNSWWWTDELFETCRVSCQNKICEISVSSLFYYKEMSCKICTLLKCYAAYSGNSLLMSPDNLLFPSSRAKISKRQNTAWLQLPDTVLLFGTLSIVYS